MKATKQEIKMGIQRYVDKELSPQLHGAKGVGIRIILAVGIDGVAEKYLEHPMLETIGIKDTEGIELDKLYEVAKQEVQKEGKVEVAGILFDASDVEKLYQEIVGVKGGM